MAKVRREKKKSDSPISRSKEGVQDYNKELVKFSFKYLKKDNKKFDFDTCDASYFLNLMERLKNVSTMDITTFRTNGGKSLRAHSIDWDKTTENSFDIPGQEQLVYEPYQFSLSANLYGRVHGFLIENRFYIVWLDRNHSLYP